MSEGLPERRWGLGDFWITCGLYLLLGLVASGLVLALPAGSEVAAWATVASVCLPWIALAGWPLHATASKGWGAVAELRLRGGAREIGSGIGFGIVGLLAAGAVAGITEKITGRPLESAVGQLADDLTKASPWPLVVLAVLAGVGAPIVEEIAFRGLLFGALEKRGQGRASCVVLSATAFALFHFEPARIPVLLALGLALSMVRSVTGSTRASIAGHMTINLLPALSMIGLAFS